MDDALEDVGRILVYDPTTRQLQLRPESPKRKNSDTDSGFSASSSKDISVSSLNLHDNIDENDIPDLDFSTTPHKCDNKRSTRLLSNLIQKLSPSVHKNEPVLTVSDDSFKVSLQKRPSNLPPKDADEEQKHKCEFAQIVKTSRKKQAKEIVIKEKHLQNVLKSEEKVSGRIGIWNTEILPFWPECLQWKKTHELWGQGVPGPVRSELWTLAIGNDLNITEELYHISLARSKVDDWCQFDVKELCQKCNNLSNNETPEQKKDFTAYQIKLDVSRTFSHLGLFQETGPYHQDLVNILAAYSAWRPDLGYSQGMSFLAAMLLLNIRKTETVFIAFCNLMNRQPFEAFYRLNNTKMNIAYDNINAQISRQHPDLSEHFKVVDLKPEYYLVDQIYTLFSRSLPLESACRIWDLYLRDGESIIYRASLALLTLYHDQLLKLDFIDIAKLLQDQTNQFNSTKFFQILSQTKVVNLKHF